MRPNLAWSTGLALLVTPLLIVLGQFLFKQAGLRLAASGRQGMMQLVTDPYLLSALCIYGVGTLLWVFVLTRMPLAQAYPVMALTYVLVPAASTLIFGETIIWTYWVGAGLIILGVAVMVISS